MDIDAVLGHRDRVEVQTARVIRKGVHAARLAAQRDGCLTSRLSTPGAQRIAKVLS